jgi:uncharacterized membrane-anchored protein
MDTSRREFLNKVPEVILYFWIIKILCTTVGETASDYLSDNLGLGLTRTTFVTGAALVAALVFQFRTRRYVPSVYWLAVVLISIVGTQITDNLTDNLGVSLVITTVVFTVVLAAVFAVWFASERTLSIHTIVTTRREAFYWLAVLVTFALGTAAGDLTAERLNLGYAVALLLFAALIGGVAVAHYGLHSHAAARRVPRRLPLASARRRRARPRDGGDEWAVRRHHRRGRRVPQHHAQGRDRTRGAFRPGAERPRGRAPDGGDARTPPGHP